MADVKVLIKAEEIEEKNEISKIIKKLNKTEKERLKGFLQGLTFNHTRR